MLKRSTCDLDRCIKLIERIEQLIRNLDRTMEIEIHRRIDQWYYRERLAEMKYLVECIRKADDMERRLLLSRWLMERAKEVYLRWRNDVRWFARKMKVVPLIQ